MGEEHLECSETGIEINPCVQKHYQNALGLKSQESLPPALRPGFTLK
jgi:hypothetical protein